VKGEEEDMTDQKHNANDTGNDETMKKVRGAFQEEVAPELKERLQASLRGFQEDLREHPYVKKLEKERHGQHHGTRWWIPRIALATGSGLIVIFFVMTILFAESSLSWASVVEKFKSVPFFSAVFYLKDNAMADPVQFELWAGRDGTMRLHSSDQVVFANRDAEPRAFNLKTRTETPVIKDSVFMLKAFQMEGEFSLESVIKAFSPKQFEEKTPDINYDAMVSEDLVVFDLRPSSTPEWARIWALRESKLPVHIRFWDARNGECMDAFFTYSREQPAEFFDPDAFARLLSDRSYTTRSLAYTYLTDPGGQPITRRDAKEQREREQANAPKVEYHLPEIKEIGVRDDGAVWVVSEKARNRKPDGDTFSGFAGMKDNLGRSYQRAHYSWRSSSDTSTEVFLPEGYPFDERKPTSAILTVSYDEYNRNKYKMETIKVGEVPVQEIPINNDWPVDDETFFPRLARVSYLLGLNKQYEDVARILDSIPGSHEDGELQVRRDILRIELLVREGEYEKAVELGKKIELLMLWRYGEFSSRYRRRKGSLRDFQYYIAALVATGRIDEAADLFKAIERSAMPEFPDDFSRRQVKKAEQGIQEDFDNSLWWFANIVQKYSKVTIKQLNRIMDTDVMTDPRFDNLRYQLDEMKKKEPWQEHQQKVVEYYKTHTLPETVELLPTDAAPGQFKYLDAVLPGIKTHESALLTSTIYHYFSWDGAGFGAGRVIIPEEIGSRRLSYDMVYNKDLEPRKKTKELLRLLGLEIVEKTEEHTVWVAHYDGRELKPYKEVKAPYPADGEAEDQLGRPGAMGAITLDFLFRQFMQDQDPDFKADGILIIDETGIPSKPDDGEWSKVHIASESPNWKGAEGPALARKWFEQEFGITFEQEIRTMTVYEVRAAESEGTR
jgi:hypothetical protein